MKTKLAGLLGVVGLGLLVAGCGGADAPAPLPTGSAGDLAQALAERTGATIVTLRDSEGTPYAYVASDTGRAVAPRAATEGDLRAFLAELGDVALGASATAAPNLGELHPEAGGAALRLRKVVQGTSVPLLDESVSVATREDGTFAFLATGAREVTGVDVAPTLGAEAAKELAIARGAENAAVPEAPELGVTTAGERPVLVYRVDVADAEGSLRVDVDAKTGEIVSEGRTELHALAYSAEHFFGSPNNDRAVPQATLECGVKNGKLVRDTLGGRVEIFDLRKQTPIAAGGFFGMEVLLADVDGKYSRPAVNKDGQPAIFSPGVAVNAQFHLGNAADFFAASRWGRSEGRTGGYPCTSTPLGSGPTQGSTPRTTPSSWATERSSAPTRTPSLTRIRIRTTRRRWLTT